MFWSDEGFLLHKNNFDENSSIVDVFTCKHGKISGIVYGGSSRKQKKNLQIGNKIFINYKTKAEGRIGYFTVEIIQPVSAAYFENKKKSICILAASSILKILLPDSQINSKIYKSFEDLINSLCFDDWISKYIFWELELLKLLGYDLELKNKVEKEVVDDKINYFVKSSSEKKIIPNFLIDENSVNVDLKSLLKGLKLVTDYLEKSILKPNNLNLPSSRIYFVNLLK